MHSISSIFGTQTTEKIQWKKMHIKLCLGLLYSDEAETNQKLLQLSLSYFRQTQPKREAWCNIIYYIIM